MGNLSEFQVSKTVWVKYYYLPKFYMLCLMLSFVFVLPLFSGAPVTKNFDPVSNFTYTRTSSGTYYYGSEDLIGYQISSSTKYRKAFTFDLDEIPQNATISSVDIVFYSGDQCGTEDGIIRCSKMD